MLMIFGIRKGQEGMHLLGHFDGQEFIAKIGHCNSIEELYEYDYIQIYQLENLTRHIPKQFFGNLLEKMKEEYQRVFGEVEQMTLF